MKVIHLYERIDGEVVHRASGSGRYVAYLLSEFRAVGFDVFGSGNPNLAEKACLTKYPHIFRVASRSRRKRT